MLVQDEKTYSGHPITSESDWCGAWNRSFKPAIVAAEVPGVEE